MTSGWDLVLRPVIEPIEDPEEQYFVNAKVCP